MEHLSKIIADTRKEKGLSLRDVARRTKLSAQAVLLAERGEVHLRTLVLIGKSIGVRLGDLEHAAGRDFRALVRTA